ncbi:MAG TPA: 3-hydroxyacyl-CoA dehydrogenase NAD-binding domain-containing protein [Myxococcales bacterium]|nr:3-hydroxyacyl-CoA dehydrogenase NAD-binding domain-containing protein [Myxococcales bacterium]
MSTTSYAVDSAVAVITLDNPPVNGLGHELRTSILAGLDRAAADPAVSAVVLIGGGKVFSGGADIKEFNSPKVLAEPSLATLIATIERSEKPVIAAIHGVAMGGGLELSLACHFRLAAPSAQIGLPEVKLGILPGAGGTQRLPRAVGVETALNMIVSGTPAAAEQLRGTALFDEIVEGDLLKAAVAFAGKAAATKRPLKLVRDAVIDYPQAEGFFQFARNTVAAVAKGYPAPAKCIDAVAAAVSKPFEEGLRVERELFTQLLLTSESLALRHAFFAERAASKIPDVPEGTPPRPIKKAAVIGAGTMGGGIAMNFANAGIPVSLLEAKQEPLDKGIATIRKNYENSAKKGKLTAAQVEERMGLIRPTLSYAEVGQADIVIEAVFEDMAVKEAVFRKLDEVMKQGAILATNTSTLDVDKIASLTRRPQDVIGTHFFSPANVMKLLEIVRGKATAKDVLATALALSKKIKKTGVVSGVCDGFIGNRMLDKYARQAQFLLEEGALPRQVDRALESFGMAMGPFRMSDLAGNDVSWYIRKRHYAEQPDRKKQVIPDRLCELGRFGQKTSAGWYRYEPGKRDAIPDPLVDDLIVAYSKEAGIPRRKIDDQEIVQRCIYALVNEGAAILEEGIALRASDIDLVYLAGYGFPPYRGGPMFHADQVGLFNVVRSMERFAKNPHADPGFWRPSPLLARLAAQGKKFNDAGRDA